MPDLLIRELDTKTIDRLKSRAKNNRRSLQAEMKLIAEEAALQEVAKVDFWALAAEMREHTRGRPQTDSAILIREGRDA